MHYCVLQLDWAVVKRTLQQDPNSRQVQIRHPVVLLCAPAVRFWLPLTCCKTCHVCCLPLAVSIMFLLLLRSWRKVHAMSQEPGARGPVEGMIV